MLFKSSSSSENFSSPWNPKVQKILPILLKIKKKRYIFCSMLKIHGKQRNYWRFIVTHSQFEVRLEWKIFSLGFQFCFNLLKFWVGSWELDWLHFHGQINGGTKYLNLKHLNKSNWPVVNQQVESVKVKSNLKSEQVFAWASIAICQVQWRLHGIWFTAIDHRNVSKHLSAAVLLTVYNIPHFIGFFN